MKSSTRLLLTLPALVLPVSCVDRDPTDPNVVPGPQLAYVHPAVDGFYFFPPIGSGVKGARLIGTESPTVDVCPSSVAVDDCDETEATRIAHFSRTSPGTGGATMGVSLDNLFQVDWDTRITDTGTLPSLHPTTYRIVVRVQGQLLGTATIAFFTSTGQANKAGGDAFAVVRGRSLPIKFGMDLTALMALGIASGDFVVETFSTDGGTQSTEVPSGNAAFQVDGQNVQLPPGFAGTEFQIVIFEKELEEGEECVTTYPGPSSGGCYVFETIPEGVTFLDGEGNPAGLAGVCPDGNTTDEYRLAAEDNGVTVFLEQAPVSVVDCEPIALNGVPRLLRPLARLLMPSPLYAKDIGETGTVGAFSTLFWAVALEIEEDPDDPPTGPFVAGGSVELSFRVVTAHNHDDEPDPVSGVTVEFSIPTGAGSLPEPSAVSAVETGVVEVTWTLPAATGNYTLTLSVPGAKNDENEPTKLEFDVTVVEESEIIVWNDGNTFDVTGLEDPQNGTLVQNLISFTGSGTRASGTKVLVDRGRSSLIWFFDNASFATAVGEDFDVVTINSSATEAPLMTIDADVKVIFLVGPEEAFTIAEINVLKQFAADGGRIVLIGEHAGPFDGTLAVQNSLLAALGSTATNIGGRIDCLTFREATAAQLGLHQVTTGVAGFRYVCNSVLALGANDVALLTDDGMTTSEDLEQPDGDTCAGDCALAAAVRISTAPIIVFSVASDLAATGLQSRSSIDTSAPELSGRGVRRR